ncbi:MAG: ATP synthase F1 subunit epsilon [Acidiphilium sp.]|jgi:F-type H+-transporting ATPase subunit epsilon
MPVALDILSPERRLLAQDVDMVVIPGVEGDLGVLPGHSKLITVLRPGLIDLYQGQAMIDRFLVRGGFAEVTETGCTVLADAIMRPSEVNEAGLRDWLRDCGLDQADISAMQGLIAGTPGSVAALAASRADIAP